MERKINVYLRKWKKDVTRKPLLIYGNKQIGKTYSMINFGEQEYKTVAYVNCENNIGTHLSLLNVKLNDVGLIELNTCADPR